LHEEIEHQLKLIRIQRTSAKTLIEQRAIGGINPYVVNQLVNARADIASRIKLLARNYGTIVEPLPGIDYDVTNTVTVTLDRDIYLEAKEIVAQYGIILPEIEE
jgi:hypothetical protein